MTARAPRRAGSIIPPHMRGAGRRPTGRSVGCRATADDRLLGCIGLPLSFV